MTAEPLQTEDTGLAPDKLIHLHPSELVDEIGHSGTEEDVEIQEQLQEDSTGQTEEDVEIQEQLQEDSTGRTEEDVEIQEQLQEDSTGRTEEDVEIQEQLQEDSTGQTEEDVEIQEQLQEDSTGRTEEDVEIQEQLQEDSTGQTEEDVEIQEQLQEDSTEETEMCKSVHHNVEPERPEAVDNSEEALVQETENAEKTENLQEIPELPEEVEEESRLEQGCCVETTSPHPERSECEQLETIREPEPTQEEVSHQIEEDHSDQLGCQHLKESPEMELTNQSARPETAERTEECTQSDRTVCVEAKDPEVPEQQQTEPPEQNEQSPQTADASQPTPSEQHVLSEDSDESEITEQTEVTEQTAEAAEQVGSPALRQAEEFTGPEDGGVRTVMANGEKHKLPETPTPQMNGGEVDRAMARRLAEQLFKLDGIQPVDVVKHLDKE